MTVSEVAAAALGASMSDAAEDIDVRRRRCLFRATHRGTKEMDWLLGRYAEAVLPSADPAAVTLWEQLVQLPDPQFHDWIMGQAVAEDTGVADVVAAIRAFHGLG